MDIKELRAAYEAAKADCDKLNSECASAYEASTIAFDIYKEANARYKSALKLSLSLNAEIVAMLEASISPQ